MPDVQTMLQCLGSGGIPRAAWRQTVRGAGTSRAAAHKLLHSSLQQGQADAPMEAEATPAPAAPTAATLSSTLKKPKTHWSGVERGCAFALILVDAPGPKGSKVGVSVALRRNQVDGLTESVEPGWKFKARGACCSLPPHVSPLPTLTSLSLSGGRADRGREWRQWRRPRFHAPRAPRQAGGPRCASH